MENTNEIIEILLTALRTVCNENGLNYILAVEAKNKPDSKLWYSVQRDTDLEKAKQIINDYFYKG